MAIYRLQRMYIAPVVGAALQTGVSMVGDMMNNNSQQQQQDKQIQASKEMQDKQNKENLKLAKVQARAANAATPDPTQSQFSIGENVKNYIVGQGKKYKDQAINVAKEVRSGLKGTGMKDVKGFGKDTLNIINQHKGTVGKVIGLGALTLGSKYVVDKAIQKDIERDKKKREKEFSEVPSSESTRKKVIDAAYNLAKKGGRFVKNNKLAVGMAVAPSILMGGQYYLGKKRRQQMEEDQERYGEREYSIKETFDKAKKSIFKHTPRSIKHSAWNLRDNSRMAKTLIKNSPKMAKDYVVSTANDIKNNPLEHFISHKAHGKGVNDSVVSQVGDSYLNGSGSKISKTVGNVLKNHKKTAALAAIPVAWGIHKTIDKSLNAFDKGIRKVDKNAFRYSEGRMDNDEEESYD